MFKCLSFYLDHQTGSISSILLQLFIKCQFLEFGLANTTPGEEVAALFKTYLHRCDGTLLGGGDSLLHGTHVSGQSGLVTHSRGDTTQQGRHLRGQTPILQSASSQPFIKKKKK